MSFEKFAALIESGLPVGKAVELSELAADPNYELLKFGIQAGAPLGPLAKNLASFKASLDANLREIELAQAVPIATRKLMLWLPSLGLVVGELLGFRTFAALGTTPGLIAFLVGLALIYLGASLTRKLIDAENQNQNYPGQIWLRFGILIQAGMGLQQASRACGIDPAQEHLIELAKRTGASLSGLVAARQAQELAQFATEKIARARALGVKLLIPLGLTTLPAFLIFTLAPMLIGINQ